MKIKNIAITGATGAIGTALIRQCIKSGIGVIAFVRSDSKQLSNIPTNDLIKIIFCSLDELSLISQEELPKCDAFFHLGWAGTFGDSRNDYYSQVKNIKYTLDAANLAKKMGAEVFVGAGSQAEYGRVDGVLYSDTPALPENGYGVAKLCAGQMSRLLCRTIELRHIWIRILSVYGPNDGAQTMVMSSIAKLMKGEKTQFTPAEQIWDYLYCDDAAQALLALASKGQDGKIYPLGGGHASTLKKYIEVIRDIVAPGAEIGIGNLPYSEKQVMHLEADISELIKDTGYIPLTPFEEGIRMTVNSLKWKETNSENQDNMNRRIE